MIRQPRKYIVIREKNHGNRFVRLFFTFNLGLIVMVSGITLGLRSARYSGCLLADPGYGRYTTLYDLRTGQSAYGAVSETRFSTPPFKYYPADAPVTRDQPSPNGKYIASLYTEQPNFPSYTLKELNSQRVFQTSGVHEIAWAPDGSLLYTGTISLPDAANFSYVARTDLATGETHMVPWEKGWSDVRPSPDGQFLAVVSDDADYRQLRQTLLVMPTANLFAPVDEAKIIRFRGSNLNWLHWSPDSRHLAGFTYWGNFDLGGGGSRAPNYPQIFMTVFGVDGTAYPPIELTLRQSERGEGFFSARWSPDGHSLLYLQPRLYLQPGDEAYTNLVALDVDTGHTRQIRNNIDGALYFSFENQAFYGYDQPDKERIAIVRRTSSTFSVELLDTFGKLQRILVSDATSVDKPIWLEDGNTLLLKWTKGYGAQRRAYLTLAYADGKTTRTIDEGDQEIERVDWVRGDDDPNQPVYALLYKARQGQTYAVKVLDLLTGERRILADGFAQIADLHFDYQTGNIAFWWRTSDDISGTDSYNLRFMQNYRYLANGPIDDGGSVSEPYDGRVVLAVGSPQDANLIFSAQDGHMGRVFRTAVSNLKDVAWSKDSTMVAIRSDAGIEVIATDGSDRSIMKVETRLPGKLSFSRCTYVNHW